MNLVGGSQRSQSTPPVPLASSGPAVSHPYFKRQLDSPLLNARIEFGPAANLPPPRHAAAKLGVRFEKKVCAALRRVHGDAFLDGLPFSFQTCNKRGRAVPDGLLFSQTERAVVLIEIKLRHTGDAWWQLERFYQPIVCEAFRLFQVIPLEICKYFDPSVRLPKPTAFVSCAEEALSIRSEAYHPVLIWSQR